MADRIEQPPHDAVAPLAQHHAVPAVRAGAAAFLQRFHARTAVVQFDALQQGRTLFGRHFAARAHGVLTFQFKTWMSEAIRQVARCGEKKKAAGIEIQAADIEPATRARRRQAVEDAGAPFRIVAAHDLALGLVIEQHPRQPGRVAVPQFPAVEQDAIMRADTGAERGSDAVHGEAAGANPFFHVAARTQPEGAQNLLQAFGSSRCTGGAWRGRSALARAR